jgi:hypothetical protein
MGDVPVCKKSKVLDALTCPVCNKHFKGMVYNCSKGHSICSLCYPGADKKCYVAVGTKLEHTFPTSFPTNLIVSGLVRDLCLPVPCKNLKSGCGHEEKQKMIGEHEAECGFKKVQCRFSGCEKVMFKDLLDHLKAQHKWVPDGKWVIARKKGDPVNRYTAAFRLWSEPNWGETFIIYLQRDDNGSWDSVVKVIGGARVAHKFRSEIRLGSCDTDDSLTYKGPVLDIDAEWKRSDGLNVEEAIFVKFNQGKNYFGAHNLKLGDTTVPITVKVTEKQLGCKRPHSETEGK